MVESSTASSRARHPGRAARRKSRRQGDVRQVLAVRTDDKKILGGADAAKAKVTGKIVTHVRGPKLKVLKYKTGGQYKIQRGHRQNYTAVEVGDIQLS